MRFLNVAQNIIMILNRYFLTFDEAVPIFSIFEQPLS